MRKRVLLLAGVVALSVPAASVAGTAPPGPKKLDFLTCKSLHAHHVAAFKSLYHSFADCLKQGKPQAKQDLANARQTCKSERAESDASFEAAHSTTLTFQQYYGANTKAKGKGAGRNAFGTCVSQHARQNVHDTVSATVEALTTCKSQWKADSTGFENTYGANTKARGKGVRRNAFGRCVSQQLQASHA